MDKSQEIANNSNKRLEQRFIQSIKKLPNFKVNSTTVHDFAYNEPIVEITPTQNSLLKNLLNEK